MFSPLYFKLAWTTMIRNRRITFPFVLGVSAMTAIFFAICWLANLPEIDSIYGGETIRILLMMGTIVIAFLLPILYFYLNGFLLKSRGQELGLFTTLGMEKRHLIMIVFWQMLMLFAASTILGLVLGLLIEKLSWLLLQQLVGEVASLNMSVSWQTILTTLEYTGLIYFFLFLYTAWVTARTDPLEQMKSTAHAETEPKARWLLAVVGIVCLAAGYGMALSVKDPLVAMNLFFIAVLFVIAGTYLFFLFGITVILKALKKNPNYYYSPKHFFSVSNLQFRIKSNAASLATICILSTMILVTMTATVVVTGFADTTAIPGDRQVQIAAAIETNDVNVVDEKLTLLKEKTEVAKPERLAPIKEIYLQANNSVNLLTMPESQMAEILGEKPQLDNAAVVYDPDGALEEGRQTFTLLSGLSFEADVVHSALTGWKSNVVGLIVTIVSDELFNEIIATGDYAVQAGWIFDSPYADEGVDLEERIVNEGPQFDFYYSVSTLKGMRDSILNLTGGLIFIGAFVSMIVLVALILILYYRQISEGFSDRKRYAIMQDLGMEKKQVMGLINSQAMLMFLLPMGVAVTHLLFASNFLRLMLVAGFGVSKQLFWMGLAGVAVVYALIYLIIYRLTAKTYYSIIRKAESA